MQDEKYPLALPQGTVLAGQYVIEKVLGQGGFGITYRALDHKTGQRVAVKEFFPDTMAARTDKTTVSAFTGERGESFGYGKACFLKEAETLAQFIGNEQIVRVFSYFEENGTAYFVMEFIEGTSFDQYIKDRGGKVPYEEAERILLPVIDALAAVHAKGIVHRDVTPDNIYITKDGGVKLLDFGAARYSLGDKSRSLDVVLKHGFAPKEQYTRHGKQGPYTDVYTVGASFYFALTGRRPPDSIDRLEEDELVPPSSLVRIPKGKEDAILKAMNVQPGSRYQTMGEFRQELTGEPAAGAQNMGGVQGSGAQPVQTGAQKQNAGQQMPSQSSPQPVQQRVFTAQQSAPMQPSRNAQRGMPQQGAASWQMQSGQPFPVQMGQNEPKKKRWLIPAGICAGVVEAVAIGYLVTVLVLPHGESEKTPANYASVQDPPAVSVDSAGGPHMTAGSGTEEQNSGTPVLHYDLPEGFTQADDGMYYAPDYPNDTANINIMTSENDQVTFRYTKDSFCEAVEYLYEQAGYDVDVNCTEFTMSELNGCRTLVIRSSYNLLGMEIEQVQFAVEIGTNTVTTITYTQEAGGAWTDAFNASIDSMRIEYER